MVGICPYSKMNVLGSNEKSNGQDTAKLCPRMYFGHMAKIATGALGAYFLIRGIFGNFRKFSAGKFFDWAENNFFVGVGIFRFVR